MVVAELAGCSAWSCAAVLCLRNFLKRFTTKVAASLISSSERTGIGVFGIVLDLSLAASVVRGFVTGRTRLGHIVRRCSGKS